MDERMHTIATTLQAHGIESRLREGRLYAANVWTLYGVAHTDWVDVTEFTTAQLRDFLNY